MECSTLPLIIYNNPPDTRSLIKRRLTSSDLKTDKKIRYSQPLMSPFVRNNIATQFAPTLYIDENISKLVEISRRLSPQIRDSSGEFNINLYTLLAGGLGDLFHGINFQKFLIDTIPNLSIRWIIIREGFAYDDPEKNKETVINILKSYHSLSKMILFYEYFSPLNDYSKIIEARPKGLPVISPVLLPQWLMKKLQIPPKDSILIHEISCTREHPDSYGIDFSFGFCDIFGIGLPFSHPDNSVIRPLEKCSAYPLLPEKQKYFFAYFSFGEPTDYEMYRKWLQYLTLMLDLIHSDEPPSFVCNWKVNRVFDILRGKTPPKSKPLPHILEKIKKANLPYTYDTDLRSIAYFYKDDENTFQKEEIVVNPNSMRSIRIINPFPISHDEFLALMKASHRIVGCTGDSSFTEAILLDKVPFYEESYATMFKYPTLRDLSKYTLNNKVSQYMSKLNSMHIDQALLKELLTFEGDAFYLSSIPNGYKIIAQALHYGLDAHNGDEPSTIQNESIYSTISDVSL